VHPLFPDRTALRKRPARSDGVRVARFAVVLLALAVAFIPALAAATTGMVRCKSGPIAISQDGSSVWVVNPDHDTVTRIAAGPDTVLAQIAVGDDPRNLAISPDGSEVWVTNYRSNNLSVISAASNSVVATLSTLSGPFGVIVTPNGQKAHVVNQLSDSLLTFDVALRTVIARKPLSHRPRAIAMLPDGSKFFVQQYLSLQTTTRTDFFDGSGTSLGTAFEILFGPVPQGDGGYPGIVQAFAVGPRDTTLWLPCMDVNPQNGPINFPTTGQLTLTSTLQAVIREVRISTKVEMAEGATVGRRRLNPAGAKVQMPADVAFTSDSAYAYLPCSFSDDVLKVNTATNPPSTLVEIPVGSYPFGIAFSPTADRAYVANFLSRDVSVINTATDQVIATVPTATEVLSASILNGKKLFHTATGRMSTDSRISCAGCHPEGEHDGVNWDFSQFGDGKRNTQNLPGVLGTQPLHTIGDRDEVQDFEANIQVLHFGQGLADGPDNPSVGTPNAGRTQDLDDLAAYVNSIELRPDSPYRIPADQSLTTAASNGKTLFEDPVVGCRFCHPAPLFTDNLLHDVGTYLSIDTSGFQGYLTPTLRNVFDTDPYLHAGHANTLDDVLTLRNPNNEHGKTSQLTTGQKSELVAYIRSIVSGKEDTTPPQIEFARALDMTEVVVRFLEPVDAATATNASNYAINNGVSVVSASLDAFQKYMGRDLLTVHLFTTPHVGGHDYTLTVSNVKDLSMNANAIPGGGYTANYTQAQQAEFTFSNIDSLYTSRLGRDIHIDNGQPTWNFGKSQDLKVGVGTSTARGIVRFDFHPMLSTVVSDTNDIVSAKIRLLLKTQASTTPVTIYAYRLLRSFVEGSGDNAGQPYTSQTNWNSARQGRFAWGTAGAASNAVGVEGDVASEYNTSYDRAFTPDDSAIVSATGNTYEWDVTHAIRWAFANPYFYNFGHLLVAVEDPSSEKVFGSLDDPTQANRPVLVITVAANAAVSVDGPTADASAGFRLEQNRPNPSAGGASIAFAIPRAERVTLRIFDASGRSVRTLTDMSFAAGAHQIRWDGRNDAGSVVGAGTYFYRIKAGRFSDVKRLVIVR